MRFTNKSALVTGGNSGIGLATARLLIAEGARVVITGRDQAKLDSAARELGENAIAIQSDVTDPAGIDAVIARVKQQFGKLDIVFANAGISVPSPLGTTTLETFNSVVTTNLTSVFFTVQAALPLLDKGAAIVLNGSVMRELGSPGSAAYAATKAGVTAMAQVFASELAPRGIRVNTVIPGATRTPIWSRGSRAPDTFAATEKALSQTIPLGHLGEADDIAKAVLFLASDDAAHITAAEIVVDGGTLGARLGAPIFRAR
jgi:NAD(P)-dependent dehydrogenase (short-subunit alcohol dehydrogenase family)